jgi:uncharacterized protein (DUF486 family)
VVDEKIFLRFCITAGASFKSRKHVKNVTIYVPFSRFYLDILSQEYLIEDSAFIYPVYLLFRKKFYQTGLFLNKIIVK